MMKFINWFIAFILVIFGFLIAIITTESTIKKRRIHAEGIKALDAETFEHFIPARFYHQEKLYDFIHEEESYKLRVIAYDVAYVKGVGNTKEDMDLTVYEGVIFIIHNMGDPFQYFATANILLEDESNIQFSLVKVDRLPIYMMLSPENRAGIILKDDLYLEDKTYNPIVGLRIDEDKDTKVTVPFSPFTDDKFVLEDPLNTYINEHNDAPREPFGVVGITPFVIINTFTAIILVTSLYFLVVGSIFFLYALYKNKASLGRKKPTRALERDIDRIKKG